MTRAKERPEVLGVSAPRFAARLISGTGWAVGLTAVMLLIDALARYQGDDGGAETPAILAAVLLALAMLLYAASVVLRWLAAWWERTP